MPKRKRISLKDLPVVRDDEGILRPEVVRDIFESRRRGKKGSITHEDLLRQLGLDN